MKISPQSLRLAVNPSFAIVDHTFQDTGSNLGQTCVLGIQAFHLIKPVLHIAQRPLRFGSPDAIEVGGDFATKTLAAPDASLDIWLTIPATCFLHKDHLNHQYHIRRALYLAGIALELNKLAIFRTQHWEFHQQNPRSIPSSSSEVLVGA